MEPNSITSEYLVLILLVIRDPELLQDLLFILCAGGKPLVNRRGSRERIKCPSLHFAGQADPIVSLGDSKQLASCFQNSQLHVHQKGHIFPQLAVEIEVLLSFLEDCFRSRSLAITSQKMGGLQAAGSTPTAPHQAEEKEVLLPTQDLLDELEALGSIFAGDFECGKVYPLRCCFASLLLLLLHLLLLRLLAAAASAASA